MDHNDLGFLVIVFGLLFLGMVIKEEMISRGWIKEKKVRYRM